MIDNMKEIVDVYFDELTKQTAFLAAINAEKDQRFLSSVLFLSILVNETAKMEHPNEEEVKDMLMKLYLHGFDTYRGDDKIITLRGDQEWMLLMLEKYVFGSYPVYFDVMSEWDRVHPFEETAQTLIDTFNDLNVPLSVGDIWEIKRTEYLVGAPFANNSDLWVHKLSDLDKDRLPSYRLSELIPLRLNEFQVRVISTSPMSF